MNNSSLVFDSTFLYPFGMPMPGRQFNAGNYRFGFNGKEMDNEVKGEANSIQFEARVFDPRLGRFLSTDPLESDYPEQSTYCFAANSPIALLDHLGMGPDGEDCEEQVSEDDIPKEKHDKPSFSSTIWNLFLGSGHNTAAQYFAHEREKQPNVAGVVTFDYDEFNTVAITYNKINTITVLPDGTNTYNTKIIPTYTIFRADNIIGDKAKYVDLSEDEFFSNGKSNFSGPVIDAPIPSGGLGRGAKGVMMLGAGLSKFQSLSLAAKHGIKTYDKLKGAVKGADAHHLFEQRFKSALKMSKGEMLSIVLTKAEHIKFTTLWRLEIGYRGSKSLITTANATKHDIENAARKIYKDYPEILKALGL